MTKKIYYIEESVSLVSAIEYLEDAIPCFIECEPVEMNYMEVSITCRNEDVALQRRLLLLLYEEQQRKQKKC